MTTAQTMLAHWVGPVSRSTPRGLIAAAAVVLFVLLPSCDRSRGVLTPPEALISPYATTAGGVLWAVAPLNNESGTSLANGVIIGDSLAARITEVEGISAVPMNRVLAAMRSLQMPAVSSPTDARRLADTLGVDGIIVGSVTSYDPYNPPRLGMTLALFSKDGGLRSRDDAGIDPTKLQGAYTDAGTVRASQFRDRPVVVVSEELNGSNQAVQMNVQRFAAGRHDPETALGWRRYLASMDLYTEFASHWMVRRLLEEERLRLTREHARPAGVGR